MRATALKNEIMKTKKKKKIAFVITLWFTVIMVALCAVTECVTYFTLEGRYEEQAFKLIRQHIEDVGNDINFNVDDEMITYCEDFQKEIPSADIKNTKAVERFLDQYCKKYGSEVSFINSKGIITVSSNREFVGFDMKSGKQSSEFLSNLMKSDDGYVQELKTIAYDGNTKMKYAGLKYADGSGFVQIGLNEDEYEALFGGYADISAMNRHIGDAGSLYVFNEKNMIVSSFHDEYDSKPISTIGLEVDSTKNYSFKKMHCEINGEPSYVIINSVRDYFIVGVIPESEIEEQTNTVIGASLALELVVFVFLFWALYLLIRKLVINNLNKVNNSLGEITNGNLDEKVEARDTYEFDVLSDDINSTVDRLKGYINEAEARIDSELEAAKTIQLSALPSVFPAYPERDEFELYATMHAAKVVGGDFYDFIMLDDSTLGFLIADVSGKSISAAMFMMKAKAIIQNLAKCGYSPAEVFEKANNLLCEDNDTKMFVTAWLGYLDINTGLVRIANAGHNPPLLIRNGKAEYITYRSGLILGVMTNRKYKEYTVQLEKDDILYLYTDGVTEATNKNREFYGEERLQNILSFNENYPKPDSNNGLAKAVCDFVLSDVHSFSENTEQADDITMLTLRFK